MQKKKTKRSLGSTLLPAVPGVMVFALLTFLTAYGVQSGALPESLIPSASLAALAAGAIAIGAFSRGGRTGLVAGGVFAVLNLLIQLAISGSEGIGEHTLIGMVLCVACTFLFSCIFHKCGRGNTKRNRQMRRRK